MCLVSIGEFARRSRLSPKALRLYDELGLLRPARVDPDSGYRFYAPGQLDQARLVASLRQIGVPLAHIRVVLGLGPGDAAAYIRAYWTAVEDEHLARRELAGYLMNTSNETRSVMYEVATRKITARRVLCLLRHVDGEAGAFALGKDFVARFRDATVPRLDGIAGAAFVIYYGQVNDDSDGPIEWCRPVPDDRADEIAAKFPSLTLRTEPAHEEAFVQLGQAEITATQWQVVYETLRNWGDEHHREPASLGVRVTFLARPPMTADSRPECDFAVPLR